MSLKLKTHLHNCRKGVLDFQVRGIFWSRGLGYVKVLAQRLPLEQVGLGDGQGVVGCPVHKQPLWHGGRERDHDNSQAAHDPLEVAFLLHLHTIGTDLNHDQERD